MAKRFAFNIKNDITKVRKELGMSVKSYPGTSRQALLVIEGFHNNLLKAWKEGRIVNRKYQDVADEFNLGRADVLDFFNNVLNCPEGHVSQYSVTSEGEMVVRYVKV